MMKALLPKNDNIAWLLVRIGAGLGFFMHGLAKLQNMEGTIGFFGSIGFAPFLAWFVAILETVGGLMLILGLGMEIIGVLLAIVMLTVIFKLKWSKGYVGMGGFELEFAYLTMLLALAMHKPTSWAIDSRCCGAKKDATVPAMEQKPSDEPRM